MDTDNGHMYYGWTATFLINTLNTTRAEGAQVTELIIKGHGGDAIQVGTEGEFLTVSDGLDVEIGDTNVTQLLKDVTNENTAIKLRGCYTLELAGRLQDALDGATVYGNRGSMISIPGTPWGIPLPK